MESGLTLCVCNSYITSLSDNMRECCSLVGSIRRTSSLRSHPSLVLLLSTLSLPSDLATRTDGLNDKHLETTLRCGDSTFGSLHGELTWSAMTNLFVWNTRTCCVLTRNWTSRRYQSSRLEKKLRQILYVNMYSTT